jgi:Lon protease-like protein
MDGAVAQRLGERLVDEAVLIDEREPGEARARHDHLEVVSVAGAVLHAQLVRVRERIAQKGFESLGGHTAMVRPRAYPVAMEEIGLFPLGIVLLPTERVPLHVFEPRYKELIGECLEHDREFGLLYADGDGVREIGTLARVIEVLERFDDGRLNVVVEGGNRFRVESLTRGRSFLTAAVVLVTDAPGSAASAEIAAQAAGSFRALAAVAGAETEEIDESSSELSFELAAQVELPADAKQRLLELDAERERLELVVGLLDAVRATLIKMRELGEHAKKNGSRLPH